ncbi:MAG: 2-dehydropantoate 2-reductase [Planctomycetes bacterium]|jgi:2-dehydropantoate 2-reductase|nr:2-dehydropantoate 2-reductase [Planctomycetota bacterium]
MNTLIYGGGAVGLGLASCLIRSGNRVDIVARPATAAALRSEGLLRTGIFGRIQAAPEAFHSRTSLAELADVPYDYILICTKSFDSAPTARAFVEQGNRVGKDTPFVLFQNGWGNAEVFSAHFEKRRIYSARVITGFRRPRPNEVEITVHADAIHIGSLFAGELSVIGSLCRAIDGGGIPCRSTDAIEQDLWAKMLYNCALNPLGAILGVPYGALAEAASTRTLMDRIVTEVFAVMLAAGYRTHWHEAGRFLEVFYGRLVPDTAQHQSSTLQDLTAGKRTEIDALNGAVLQLAQKHGVAVPYNRAVYSLIQFLESARRS